MLDPLEEIKSRLDIIQVVREYMPNLKQVGANWKALCPFHNEKTPSFMVSPEKQIWHCFGCSSGGDIFTFVMKYENVEFPEALRILAAKAGVKLQRQDPRVTDKKTRLLDLCETAADYWHKLLIDSPAGQKALDYLLKKRQVKSETVEDFKLGFALDSWDALGKFLQEKRFAQDEIINSGLVVEKPANRAGYRREFYDRFRNRIMFPLKDVHGNIIGFTSRSLAENAKEAKYINTPQTLIYDKSRVLYGLDKAKSEIRKQDLAVIVEGNMDVIASHESGAINVVASSGTALTPEQIKLLKRYSLNIAMCFDMDVAGEAATERGINTAIEEGMNVKIIQLAEGIKDPDECIKKDFQEWTEAIKDAQSVLDYFFKKTLAKHTVTTVDGKKQVAKILLRIIAKIPDQVEQTHYLQKLSEILKVEEKILRESLPSSPRREPKVRMEPVVISPKDKNTLLSEQLLALAMKFPENLGYIIDHLSLEIINRPDLKQLYKSLIIYYTNANRLDAARTGFDWEKFKQNLKNKELKGYIDTLLLLADKDFSDYDEKQIRLEVLENIKLLKKDYIAKELEGVAEKLKRAESERDKEKIDELSKRFGELAEQLVEFK